MLKAEKVNIVSESSIPQCRTIHRNLVPPCPRTNTFIIINLLSHLPNQFTTANHLPRLFLFLIQLLKQRLHELLKLNISVVWNENISDAVASFFSQFLSVSEKKRSQPH